MSDRIVDFVGRAAYRPMRARPLARAMNIPETDYRTFHHALDSLCAAGKLALGGGSLVRLPATPGRLTGVFRAHRRGFGFVTPQPPIEEGDLFIPPGATLDAQEGDTVLCNVRRRGFRDGKPDITAEVVEITRRGHTQCVGKLQLEAGRWFVQPDGTKLHQPVYVDDVGAKHGRAGDVVVVEIVKYPQAGQVARGVIVERLGAAGKMGVDVLAMIRQHHLPDVFSRAALDDARDAAQAFDAQDELPRRLDLRDRLIVTIDPVDARDFDDAISLERLHTAGDHRRTKPQAEAVRRHGRKPERGPAAWELGVHIADVSHFVREGGPLDAESLERGTSVYFPRHVVPMLPELLSNGVCSLQEAQERLCKSAFIRYDDAGHVVGARFANTIIRSGKRLTYEQASAVVEGRDPPSQGRGAAPNIPPFQRGGEVHTIPPLQRGGEGGLPHAVVALLREMDTLARAIRQRRLAEGMLVLDLPEVQLELDDEGRVTDAHPADQSFSHTIIEMFMVEANEAVARFLSDQGEAFLRRVHPDPDPEALDELAKRLRAADCHVSKHPDRLELQRVLDSVRGKPAGRVVNMAVLRSMAQAVYAPRAEGHYALASKDYCHFTSPIRRYPDLHIHRLLQRHVGETSKRQNVKTSKSERLRREVESDALDVAALGTHCSITERRAEKAERELKLVKVLELLSQNPGEAFDGFVTGVMSFGAFVQHPRFMVDGLVEVIDLPDDRWQLDETRGALIGRRTGRRIAIGDVLRVAVARVDVAARRLSLALVDEPAMRAVAPKQDRPKQRGRRRRR